MFIGTIKLKRLLILTALLLAVGSAHTARADLITLTSFNGYNGFYPSGFPNDGQLLQIGSRLYGVTGGGGPAFVSAYSGQVGDGTIFSVPLTGGTPTVVASFNGTDGSDPVGSLIQNGSTLYGITKSGGANNDGTVFSVPVSGGTPTVLASFNSTTASVV